MKSKIGMVLAGAYLLAFVVLPCSSCHYFLPGAVRFVLFFTNEAFSFLLLYPSFLIRAFFTLLSIPPVVIAGLNILINVCILYFIGLGITKLRGRNKVNA